MPTSSSFALRMSHSGIRAVMELALRDPEAIHLEVGQPDLPTPEHIIDAAAHDARAGHTGYTSSTGSVELRTALAEKVTRDNGLQVTPDQVAATHGAMNALAVLFHALLGVGDELLLPDPEFPNWRMAALTTGADVTSYPTRAEDGFIPRLADVEAAITSRTKAILICSPNNPTGAVYPAALLEALVALARERDLWVISDECYEAITFGVDHVSAARFDTDGRVFTVFSFSKTHAMTGWRLGYLVLPDETHADQIAQIAEAMIACPSVLSQRAGIAALRGDQVHVDQSVEVYRTRRDAAVAQLAEAGVHCLVPDGAFYLMVDVHDVFPDGQVFALRLLAEEHVAVAPGEAFGAAGAGWVRLSLASDSEQLRVGVERVIALLARERAARAG